VSIPRASRRQLTAAASLLVMLSGCVTSTEIRTIPAGASVYVNDQLLGSSPVTFSTPDNSWRPPYRVRAELRGYQQMQGELTPVTATGRVTGAIFTLGIVAAVRPMSTFEDSYTFALVRDPNANRPGAAGSTSARTIDDELAELKRLYDEGDLSAKEYQDAKERLLKEF
jgi:hypothetical protein